MDTPNTIIYVRDYQPLSVTFPPPGSYLGRILIVLPSPDPTILSRLTEGGSSPTTLEFVAEEEIEARSILSFLETKKEELKTINQTNGHPILVALYNHLKLSKRGVRGISKAKLIELDNPLDMPPD